MRPIPILTALVVMAALYLLVFERPAVIAFAQGEPREEQSAPAEPEAPEAVSVVALRSEAEQVDSAVVLRGRTEAARQVEVRAETSGKVVSAPLRKGALVEDGDLLCELDPGTREVADRGARRDWPRPAQLPEAEARVTEAEARLREAEINDRAASSLSQDGFAAETRVAATEAAVQAPALAQASRSAPRRRRAAGRGRRGRGRARDRAADHPRALRRPAGNRHRRTRRAAAARRALRHGDPARPDQAGGLRPRDRRRPGRGSAPRPARGSPRGAQVQGPGHLPQPLGRPRRRAPSASRSRSPTPTCRSATARPPRSSIAGRRARSAHLLPQSALTLNDEGAARRARRGRGRRAPPSRPVTVLRDTPDGVWVAGLRRDGRRDRRRTGIRHRRACRVATPTCREAGAMTGIVDWAAARARMIARLHRAVAARRRRAPMCRCPRRASPTSRSRRSSSRSPSPASRPRIPRSCWSSRWRPSSPTSTGSRR